ncbi:hypothetical protein C8J56DRAFT_936909 [Mycena floridula]|nr:hypothetical protein C8J56DRAFT_936909 [Mycena floridula]
MHFSTLYFTAVSLATFVTSFPLEQQRPTARAFVEPSTLAVRSSESLTLAERDLTLVARDKKGKVNKPHQCPVCYESFAKQSELDKHRLRHTQEAVARNAPGGNVNNGYDGTARNVRTQ